MRARMGGTQNTQNLQDAVTLEHVGRLLSEDTRSGFRHAVRNPALPTQELHSEIARWDHQRSSPFVLYRDSDGNRAETNMCLVVLFLIMQNKMVNSHVFLIV